MFAIGYKLWIKGAWLLFCTFSLGLSSGWVVCDHFWVSYNRNCQPHAPRSCVPMTPSWVARLWFHKHHWRICCYVTFNTIGYILHAPGSLKNRGEGDDPIGKKFLLRRWPTVCPWSVIDRSVPTTLSLLGNGEISLDYCHDFSPFNDGVVPLQQSKTVCISWSHEEWKRYKLYHGLLWFTKSL